MILVWKPVHAVVPPQSFVPTRHHFLQVPKTQVSPTAQPAVAMHAAPICALPAVTQSTPPLVSWTSHVSASVQPHCGTSPHLLLGAVRLHVSGASGFTDASLSVVAGPD